jgi:hypothetical protein
LRLRSAGALAVTLAALAAAGAALADADPASDVLYVNNVFLPLSTPVSQPLARQLAAATRAAGKSGNPIRVALIAKPADLGGVPSLFGKPTQYARFLGAELVYLYTGRLLVVMPQGAALAERGRLVANAAVVHARVEGGADGLAKTALALVRTLSREAPPSPGAGRSQGFPAWASAALAAGGAACIALLGFVLVRRRLHRHRP